MKRFLYLFLMAGLWSTGLSAQVSVGVNVFYNQAWQQYSEDLLILRYDTYLHKVGASATVQYDIDRCFSLVIEPGFVQRGTPVEPIFGLPIIATETSFTGSYIEMPVLAQARVFALQDRLQFFAQLGAGYAYLLSARRDVDFLDEGIPSQHQRVNFDNEININRLDFGYYGGGGLGVQAGPGYLTATCRYYHGMPRVNDFWDSKNRTLNFILGYRIAL